jgi:hypothetical protein
MHALSSGLEHFAACLPPLAATAGRPIGKLEDMSAKRTSTYLGRKNADLAGEVNFVGLDVNVLRTRRPGGGFYRGLRVEGQGLLGKRVLVKLSLRRWPERPASASAERFIGDFGVLGAAFRKISLLGAVCRILTGLQPGRGRFLRTSPLGSFLFSALQVACFCRQGRVLLQLPLRP